MGTHSSVLFQDERPKVQGRAAEKTISPDGQTGTEGPLAYLPFDLPPAKKRKRRRRLRVAVRSVRRTPKQLFLLRAPQVQRCGFCGTMVTVLQDAAACPVCAAIISRDEE